MILTQAGMFVLPAVLSAFVVSFPMIYIIYTTMISDSLGYTPSVVPSLQATINALIIGIMIPFLSSIVPIRRGLSANLNETLDSSRSKSKGAEIIIVDQRKMNLVPYLTFGSVAVCFGIAVYYGLPIAMLELKVGLLLSIFFILLLGMLLGLVLIAVNVQSTLEQFLLTILLFWEKKSMRTVLRKNMITHNKKNKLTAIIFALSLGCIIFLLTSASLQINLINSTSS